MGLLESLKIVMPVGERSILEDLDMGVWRLAAQMTVLEMLWEMTR